ncbi:DNA-directed RNA polymerase subunit K [Candidatus Pacearchaeota archaeon]|nr:DNA-directed RNA polymerase subunit K [Candidatus Pacearchaeota archaeon]
MMNKEFSKYERARIIGARGLQISMDAPILMDMDEKELDGVNYDPLVIAEKELDSGILPISVNRPMPERKEADIQKIKVEETDGSDAEKEEFEKEEGIEIANDGEMLELVNSGEESKSDESLENVSSEDRE